MVGAADRAAAAPLRVEQHRTAMTTKVSKTPQLPGIIKNDKNLGARDIGSNIVALVRKMTARRDQLPAGVEDSRLLPVVDGGIRVIPRFKIALEHALNQSQVPQKVARTTSSGRGGV